MKNDGEKQLMSDLVNVLSVPDTTPKKCGSGENILIEARGCDKIIFVGGQIVVHNYEAGCAPRPDGHKHLILEKITKRLVRNRK